MAAISVNDGGTWRTPYQVSVNDGGTWRTIQQVYVNDGGTWRTVFQYLLLDAVVTEGTGGTGSAYHGYSASSGYGSITSALVANAYTLDEISSEDISGSTTLRIGGFSSDPGQSFFSSIAIGGVSKTSASASVYSYSSGTATWIWSSYSTLDGVGTSTVVITP